MKKNNLKLYIFVIISYCYVINAEIGCQDEDGSSVDWWAAIKYPDGTTYAYADANSDSFKLSSNDMKYKTTGALSETLQQVYKGSSKTVGYAMYNDESPNGDKFGTAWGHFKGVVATDKSNGFWLIHSAPRFPETVANGYDGYPDFASKYGQSFLCTSLDADTINTVGIQMQMARGHIYDANVPSFVNDTMPDFADAIGGKHVTSGDFTSVKKITTRGGASFTSFMKAGKWDKELYEYLVAPTLGAGVYAETWQNGVGATPSFCNTSYSYNALNINELVMPDGTSWTNSRDHSKWCCTMDRGIKVACIGGINRQHGQFGRGGGTLCFQDNENMWESMYNMVKEVKPCADK